MYRTLRASNCCAEPASTVVVIVGAQIFVLCCGRLCKSVNVFVVDVQTDGQTDR